MSEVLVVVYAASVLVAAGWAITVTANHGLPRRWAWVRLVVVAAAALVWPVVALVRFGGWLAARPPRSSRLGAGSRPHHGQPES